MELSSFLADTPGLGVVAFGLIGLTQAIEVARILIVGLFQFRDRSVVVLFRKSDSAGEFMREFDLSGIL